MMFISFRIEVRNTQEFQQAACLGKGAALRRGMTSCEAAHLRSIKAGSPATRC
jgi:hypothetical protein